MSIKSAQLYIGDGEYVEKESREITLTSEVKTKIDNIPSVVSTFDSTSTTDALSAAAGKQLKDQLDSIGTLWKYLSAWDCATWLPATDPIDNPHRYVVWDYYVIANVGTGTKYKPDSYQYTHWVPSTAEEEWDPQINDSYYYDWTYWVLQPSGWRVITVDSALSSSSTNPVENRVVNSALSGKQATISDLATIRSWAALGATAIQPGANISTLTNNSWFATTWEVSAAITAATANFQTWSQVDAKIATATADFVTSNEVDSQISSALSTGNYTTASDVSSAISTATQWMVTETSLATKWYQTQWQVNAAISNATANMVTTDNLAAYNYQTLQQVNNIVNPVVSRVSSLESEVSSIDSSIDWIEWNISTLQSDISTVEWKVWSLETIVEDWLPWWESSSDVTAFRTYMYSSSWVSDYSEWVYFTVEKTWLYNIASGSTLSWYECWYRLTTKWWASSWTLLNPWWITWMRKWDTLQLHWWWSGTWWRRDITVTSILWTPL